MALRYCPRCGMNVDTEHSWSVPLLIVLLIFLTLIGLIYMALTYKQRCPRCHLSEEYLAMPMAAAMPVQYAATPYATPYAQPVASYAPAYAQPVASYAAAAPAVAASAPCPTCRSPLQYVSQYQRWWCAREQQYK